MAINKRRLDRAVERVRASEAQERVPVRKLTPSGAEAIKRSLDHTPVESALLHDGYHPTNWLGFGMPLGYKAVECLTDHAAAFSNNSRMRFAEINRPVPRRASAHYYNSDLTSGGPTAYFY